jgi:hypothetical protein
MSEAEVIAILGEPASRAIIDTPGLYWCYGSDRWKQWEPGDVYCGSTALHRLCRQRLSIICSQEYVFLRMQNTYEYECSRRPI